MRELDDITIENGFPVEIFDDLLVRAELEYQRGVKEYGSGKNWLDDDPRYHIYKAVDEMFQARADTRV